MHYCDAYLKTVSKWARSPRKCGSRATAGYVDGIGWRCRVHAPRSTPCPICGRITCRGEGPMCLLRGIQGRAKVAGWREAPFEHQAVFGVMRVPRRFLPKSLKEDTMWVPCVAVSVWKDGQRGGRLGNPHVLKNVVYPRFPDQQIDALMTRYRRYRVLGALGD